MQRYAPLFLCLLIPFIAFSQTVQDYTVQVTATLSTSPTQITLEWPAHSNATNFQVNKKQPGANSWGTTLASLPATATSWTDTSVAVGEVWEYRIRKNGSGYTGWGYIQAGIEAPAIDHRGRMVLIVDSTYLSTLSPKLNRLVEDLRGDGWSVIRHDVDRNDTVPHIKDLIRNAYNAYPGEVKSVFLFGHVPVPYSGNFGNNAPWFAPPDAHSNHGGAWPADVYYGDVNGTWTDFSVNNTTAARTANHNIPGDGKWDQSTIASDIELAVGRVDMADLSSFPSSEADLLAHYLDKDHAYRHKQFSVPEKAIIDDNFGVFSGEVFAANGWRNFAPLIGPSNVASGDYRTELNASGHLWAYGCGGGSYTNCNGIGNTGQIVGDSLQGVFSLMFGSYFGDWDSPNNLLRAPLANKGTILASAWAGRPHWQFHPMGMGSPIGECARISQNNQTLYFASFFYRLPHIALMGDPSLRMHILAPPVNLTVTPVNADAENQLTWTASPDSVLGYYIYRALDENGPFERITPQIVNGFSYTDSCPDPGRNYYWVRAVHLQESPSGSYYNLSQGISGNATNIRALPQADFSWTLSGDSLFFTNSSQNADQFFWIFGDGGTSNDENPVHHYQQDSLYSVQLIASDGCKQDTFITDVNFVSRSSNLFEQSLIVFPNPSSGKTTLQFPAQGKKEAFLTVLDSQGRLLFRKNVFSQNGQFSSSIDLSSYPRGVYWVRINLGSDTGAISVLKQ